MVRFKNRYILADYSQIQNAGETNDRSFLKLVKQVAQEMLGELFLAKITFSLQIKYMNMGKVLIRVPRDHSTNLIACIFIIKGLKIVKVSGTIRGIQKKLYELARK
jgi:RNase P/RNase MRP subunit POP5